MIFRPFSFENKRKSQGKINFFSIFKRFSFGNLKFALLAIFCLFWGVICVAASDLYTFSTPEQRARFEKLTAELRCLVCQNQSLADSNAAIAQDLRREVAILVNQHESDEQVVQFLVQRYGDFVVYKPPFSKKTWLLWLAPVLFLIIGFFVLTTFHVSAKPWVGSYFSRSVAKFSGMVTVTCVPSPSRLFIST